jgi:hypothetical protein
MEKDGDRDSGLKTQNQRSVLDFCNKKLKE